MFCLSGSLPLPGAFEATASRIFCISPSTQANLQVMLDQIASEQIVNQLGAASSTMLVIKDLQHRFLYANEAYLEHIQLRLDDILGRDDLEIGRTSELVLGNEESGWPGLWALDGAVVAQGEPSESIDTSSNRFDHHEVQKHVLRCPLRSSDGEIVALMVQLRDVTAEQHLKKEYKNNLNTLNALDADIVTLDAVMEALLACRDTASLGQLMVDNALDRTCADGAYLCVLNESQNTMDFVAQTGLCEEVDVNKYISCDHGVCGKAWRERKTIYVENAAEAGSIYPFSKPTQVCVCPIVIEEKTKGLLIVSVSNSNDYLKNSLPLLERLVGLYSIALANTQLMESTEKSLYKMRTLTTITKELMTVKDAREATDFVCQLLLSAIDVTHSACYLKDKDGNLATMVEWRNIDGREHRELHASHEMSKLGIQAWVSEHGRAATISRLATDARESPQIHAMREQNNIGCTVCLPIFDRSTVVGAILVSRDRSRNDLSEEETGFLLAIVNILSTALERLFLADELHHQAYHDLLTGLPNRRSLEKTLQHRITCCRQTASACSILFLDLNGFKLINDSYGHAFGDRLLSMITDRLQSGLKPDDLLTRLGGDEFAILLGAIAESSHAQTIGNRLIDSLAEPFLIDSTRITVGATIGISCFPADGNSVDELVHHADMAMYQAKLADHDKILCFTEELGAHSRQRAQTEHDLRNALIENEFTLHYQPLVDCDGNGVASVEALIRWQHPEHGLLSPSDFIPVAESAGLIDSIDDWVVNEACRQLREWRDGPLSDLRIGVNIGASHFQRIDFADQITCALNRHGACAEKLVLEVTESIVMRDIDRVTKCLNTLRSKGVRIAIDDFGTGYSSLSYLQDLPLDALKIDSSFVSRLSDPTQDQSLIKTIQLLASALGLRTVAEGVENVTQRDAVMQLGCNVIQGYFYSKPVTVPELLKLVTTKSVAGMRGSQLTFTKEIAEHESSLKYP